jgi:hydroxymethylpyrimidine pyrophosphatase-like HAD family hydrolase
MPRADRPRTRLVAGAARRENRAVTLADRSALGSGPVELVVTDLDGTLWHTDDHVDPAVIAAVREVERRGVPVLVATGRRVGSTRRPLERIGLTPPAVVLNGALGLDLATGERFHRSPYATADAVAVLEAFTACDLQPVVHVDHPTDPDVHAFLGPQPSTHPDHAAGFGSSARTAPLAEVVATVPVLGFSLIGLEHGRLVAVRDAVGDRAETHLDRSLDYPGLATLTVAPRGQSKWDGVLAFCRRHHLDPNRVLAVADGSNDLELLDAAMVRLVPEVAHAGALARADHVIPAAADGGWVQVLDHLG